MPEIFQNFLDSEPPARDSSQDPVPPFHSTPITKKLFTLTHSQVDAIAMIVDDSLIKFYLPTAFASITHQTGYVVGYITDKVGNVLLMKIPEAQFIQGIYSYSQKVTKLTTSNKPISQGFFSKDQLAQIKKVIKVTAKSVHTTVLPRFTVIPRGYDIPTTKLKDLMTLAPQFEQMGQLEWLTGTYLHFLISEGTIPPLPNDLAEDQLPIIHNLTVMDRMDMKITNVGENDEDIDQGAVSIMHHKRENLNSHASHEGDNMASTQLASDNESQQVQERDDDEVSEVSAAPRTRRRTKRAQLDSEDESMESSDDDEDDSDSSVSVPKTKKSRRNSKHKRTLPDSEDESMESSDDDEDSESSASAPKKKKKSRKITKKNKKTKRKRRTSHVSSSESSDSSEEPRRRSRGRKKSRRKSSKKHSKKKSKQRYYSSSSSDDSSDEDENLRIIWGIILSHKKGDGSHHIPKMTKEFDQLLKLKVAKQPQVLARMISHKRRINQDKENILSHMQEPPCNNLFAKYLIDAEFRKEIDSLDNGLCLNNFKRPDHASSSYASAKKAANTIHNEVLVQSKKQASRTGLPYSDGLGTSRQDLFSMLANFMGISEVLVKYSVTDKGPKPYILHQFYKIYKLMRREDAERWLNRGEADYDLIPQIIDSINCMFCHYVDAITDLSILAQVERKDYVLDSEHLEEAYNICDATYETLRTNIISRSYTGYLRRARPQPDSPLLRPGKGRDRKSGGKRGSDPKRGLFEPTSAASKEPWVQLAKGMRWCQNFIVMTRSCRDPDCPYLHKRAHEVTADEMNHFTDKWCTDNKMTLAPEMIKRRDYLQAKKKSDKTDKKKETATTDKTDDSSPDKDSSTTEEK